MKRSGWWMVLLLATGAACAGDGALPYAAKGTFTVETIEFPDLTDASRNGVRVPIKVHLPAAESPVPVIVVSHGAGGCWDTHFAQAQHLASHGYAVLCVEHLRSNAERMRRDNRLIKNLDDMRHDPEAVLGRPRAVRFAISQAESWNESHARMRGRLDMKHVGVMGHSFGAFTTMLVCGMRPALDWLKPPVQPAKGLGNDLGDRRVVCGVALSPQSEGEPFFLKESFASLRVPLMGITGSKDVQQNGLPAEARRRAFTLWPENGGRNRFVWITNARHLDFTDSGGKVQFGFHSQTREDVQPLARAATLLFFNAHLKGDATAADLITSEGLRPCLRGSIDKVEVDAK